MLEILDPTPVDLAQTISEGISRSNLSADVQRENFAVVHRDAAGLIGGVTASVSFSILFINNIWVEDGRRGLGVGTELMLAAEKEGQRRGARLACVDTLSSQAPEFYSKLGYLEFGRLSGETNGHPLDRIWFQKPLSL